MRRRGVTILRLVILTALALQVSACTYSQSRVVRPGTLSPTVGPMIFKDEGSLVLMTVGVVATRFHGKDPFIPLDVGIANKGIAPYMSINRESLYLMDTFGRRYGMASIAEVRRLQPNASFDRRLAGGEFTASKYDPYRWVESQFFPLAGAAIVRDRVELHRFSYMRDVLYFPRPEGELNGGIFELHLKTKELPEEVFVVFEVPRE